LLPVGAAQVDPSRVHAISILAFERAKTNERRASNDSAIETLLSYRNGFDVASKAARDTSSPG
jgi:hypothetical protein